MGVTNGKGGARWLMLPFSLATKRASQSVEVWRKLQRYGAVPLGNSGSLLPNNPTNQERFEWLATAIRKYAGEASVVKVQSTDNLSAPQLVARCAEARARQYQELIPELQNLASVPPEKRPASRVRRLTARFREIVEIDFFNSPLQKRVEELLARTDMSPSSTKEAPNANPRGYFGSPWGSRPPPGIEPTPAASCSRWFFVNAARGAFASVEPLP